jgi:LL-diaminopimelate aminotransferase
MVDVQKLYAARIGGSQFGLVQKVFKFTLIENAKREFKESNPSVKLIDMGVGEPEERAPENIINALYSAALKKENRIYPNNGVDSFKKSVAAYINRLINVPIDYSTEVVHCMGAKNALAQIPLAFVNPGDTVVTTTPGYPVLPTMVEYLGGKVERLPLWRKNSFLPEISALKSILEKQPIKLLLLNYPNNPCGATAPIEFYKECVELAHKYNFLIIQDAAYADHSFDRRFASPLQVDGGKECSLEVYSLSKSYNMQGFRLGFVIGGSKLVKAYALAKDNTDNGQFIAIQMAGCEALDSSAAFLAANAEKYKNRLVRVAEILKFAGLEPHIPGGTFYLYLPVPSKWRGESFSNAQSFSDYLIKKLGIVSVPWDEAGAHVRLSMTFEVGTSDFQTEEDVYHELRNRLVSVPILFPE